MDNREIKVLLIEDNPGDARLIREMLVEEKGRSFVLKQCDRLSTGLVHLAGGDFDVVLLDLGLPDSEGFETLNRVCALALGVPVVVLTVLGDEEVGIKAVQSGAQDYLVKGRVDGELLWRSMRYAIERKQMEQELMKHREHLEELVEKRTAELKKINEEARRRLKQLQTLRNIDLVITASLDLGDTLNAILKQVTFRLGVHAAAILLLNPRTQSFEHAAGLGFRFKDIERFSLPLGGDRGEDAFLRRRIVKITDLYGLCGAGYKPARIQLLTDEGFVAYYGIPLFARGQVKGMLEIFHRAPLDPDPEWLDFLKTLAGQAAIAIDNAVLFDDLQRSNTKLALAYDATIEGWARALDMRDKETEGHSRRVTEMTVRLARAMGFGEAELTHVRRGALLHDIGKLGVPDHILLKPGPLSAKEWEIMRSHPVYAYEMLSPITYLRPALDIPHCHHEKWDGTGYPRGLRGGEIPPAARIFAVVDVWDALRSDRPYRPAWPADRVLEYIRGQAGKHFDPKVVEAFLETELHRL